MRGVKWSLVVFVLILMTLAAPVAAGPAASPAPKVACVMTPFGMVCYPAWPGITLPPVPGRPGKR